MNSLQVVLFAAVAAMAFAQFDGADFSSFGHQGAGADASQFDSSAFGADAGASFGAHGVQGAQDFQRFQNFDTAGADVGSHGLGGQQFDASAFANAFGGDAEAAHHFQ